MKNKYCLPVIKNTESEVLAEIKTNEANYGFFEIWLDYITDLNEKFLSTMLAEYTGRLVFVFRRKDLEKPKLKSEEQLDIAKIFEGGDCLVDFDIYDQSELIKLTKNNKLKTIISYHNYKKTPAEEELNKILSDISACNPEITKLATFCRSKADTLLLLKIMLEMKNQNKKHIILGMGKEGLVTRLYGALWGNELTFITEKKEDASAPGQLTRVEFEKMIEGIKGGRK
ncbi:MAG TPA: type I 3-dehydroquinate dehydratase [Candidatus Saccharimonadales bacterium]|nr:type I 3-dehydroquinate dehydratase [Candidatus Saccharimonadales bacterium]